MPKRRDPLSEPRSYMAGAWPDGIIRPGAPAAVHYIRDIVVTIKRALTEQGLGQYEISRMANLEGSTVRYILTGHSWPDMVTLQKIEQVLGITVWPGWGNTRVRELEAEVLSLQEQLRETRRRARARTIAAKKVAAAAPAKKVTTRQR